MGDDDFWDRAAQRRLRMGELEVLSEGRSLEPVLHHAGEQLLRAGDRADRELVQRCSAALQQRDAEGDRELAAELLAELSPAEPAARPALTAVPVDLSLLGSALDGDPMQGDGALDLITGDVYPPGLLDADPPEWLDDDSEDFDDERIRYFQPESSSGYWDMRDFTSSLADGPLKEQLRQALEGKGAFRRFRRVLDGEAVQDQLTRWTLFRDERQLGRARAWLAAAGYRPSIPTR
ncbi:hypothetical protein ACFTSF_21065 [Kribbella sp. NPDC056951]|uniref:hypothetical protein n=1 Tax=Kribbella sp. NPDC056951 TaxID=3345978 RepID=UPI003630822E